MLNSPEYQSQDLQYIKELLADIELFRPLDDPKNVGTVTMLASQLAQKIIEYKENYNVTPDIIPTQTSGIPFVPHTLPQLKQKETPPLTFYIDGILQKPGRTLISASKSTGKSFFLINMMAAICSGKPFLNHFATLKDKPNILYLDFEIGEAAFKERVIKMGKDTDLENFYVYHVHDWDMLDAGNYKKLEDFIFTNDIKILVVDTLGSSWHGNENKKEDVKRYTDIMDTLWARGVSVCLVHHWRKMTKDQKDGGEMASGSHRWEGWPDNHITLQGDTKSIIVKCEKSRNRPKWPQIIISLNPETLTMSYKSEFSNDKKYTDADLVGLFNSFGTQFVLKSDLVKKGRKFLSRDGVQCSKTTIYRLIEDSKYIGVNTAGPQHRLYLRAIDQNMEEIDAPELF